MKRKKSTTKTKDKGIEHPLEQYKGPSGKCTIQPGGIVSPMTTDDSYKTPERVVANFNDLQAVKKFFTPISGEVANYTCFDDKGPRESEEQKQKRLEIYKQQHGARLAELAQLVTYRAMPEEVKNFMRQSEAHAPRVVFSDGGALESASDALSSLAYVLNSITNKKSTMDNNELQQELHHANRKLRDEGRWLESIEKTAHDLLERVEYLTTQRKDLEGALAEEKRRVEYLSERLEDKDKIINEKAEEIKRRYNLLAGSEAGRKAAEETITKLNEKLKAQKSAARKRAGR